MPFALPWNDLAVLNNRLSTGGAHACWSILSYMFDLVYKYSPCRFSVPSSIATGGDKKAGSRIYQHLRNKSSMMTGNDFELNTTLHLAGGVRLACVCDVPKPDVVTRRTRKVSAVWQSHNTRHDPRANGISQCLQDPWGLRGRAACLPDIIDIDSTISPPSINLTSVGRPTRRNTPGRRLLAHPKSPNARSRRIDAGIPEHNLAVNICGHEDFR